MSEQLSNENQPVSGQDVKDIVRQAIQEFVQSEQRKAEPAYKAELQDERKRRENLESRLNLLVEENKKARAMAEEADRNSQIRSELQRLGISKVDLAFKAIKDDITRSEDGRLQSKGPEPKSLQDYLSGFVQDNPELMPARISGGSGAKTPVRNAVPEPAPIGIELDNIKPGMKKEDLEKVRQEIARIAQQAIRGF
jgi:predicted RNase H-like nuclease (RuvC/YqgF family)